MKKIVYLLIAFHIIVCGLIDLQEVMAQPIIKVVGNHAPPFRIIEDEKFYGIYFDIIKEVGNRIKADIKFVNQPFKRALVSMRNGSTDIMCGPNKTSEREAYMFYIDVAIDRAVKAFYVRPDDAAIEKYEDLFNKSIATHRGNVYFDRFDKDPLLRKAPVNSYNIAILKVLHKRNDVVIMPEIEGDYLLKEMRIRLKKSPFTVEGEFSYITISKRSDVINFRFTIENALMDMNQDGKIKEIFDRYRP